MGLDIQENVPLAPFTTLRAGGPARYFTRATTAEDVAEAVSWADSRSIPLLPLGGGSNLVIGDAGHPGLVLQLGLRGIDVHEDGDAVLVRAAAGEPWDDFVALAVARGWAGVECLSGIPGLVGATPIQNVGAYGQEVAETIVAVEALDRTTGEMVRFDNAGCAFGYRMSRFKAADHDRYVVLGVTFRLRPGGAPAVRYAELARHLDETGTCAPTLAGVRDAVRTLRRRKSMVLDDGDPNTRSAGSFFMNPILSEDEAERVAAAAAALGVLRGGATMPRFPCGDGLVKLSAAWLIERAGFHKGHGAGRVGLSTNHTLAVVNRGGASGAEIAAFAREVRDGVRARFGVALHPEPVFVGHSFE